MYEASSELSDNLNRVEFERRQRFLKYLGEETLDASEVAAIQQSTETLHAENPAAYQAQKEWQAIFQPEVSTQI